MRYFSKALNFTAGILFTLLSVNSVFGQTVYNFAYTGSQQSITLQPGIYSLEVWGAQGGTGESYQTDSKGGYASGEINLPTTTTFYIYVGGQGEYFTYGTSTHSTAVSRYGGWNGGGGTYNSAASFGTGGGGTDIALVSSSITTNQYRSIRTTTSYNSRIIVGGGGGGNGNWQRGVYAGGGSYGIGSTGYVGTQSTAGSSPWDYANASFGYGSTGEGYSGGSCGGGGGWYGGAGGKGASNNGGGGSGYVYTSSSYKPSGYNPGTQYYLSDTSLVAGNAPMPDPSGGTMTGSSGNGYARITLLCYPPSLTVSSTLSVYANQANFNLAHSSLSSGTLTYSSSDNDVATIDAATGEVAIIGAGTVTLTVSQAAYDDYCADTATMLLTVSKPLITITPSATQSKTYGALDPTIEYTVSPTSVSGISDVKASLTGVLSRTSGEDVGTYSITLGTLTNTNYNINYVGADFTITKAPTTIEDGDGDPATDTLSNTTITFGDADILLTPSSSNTADYTFTSSDSSVASITITSTNTAAIRNLKVGSAIITIAQGADANYQAKTVTYTLTVSPLAVTLTPTLSQSKVHGDADPSLTYTSSPAVGTSLSNGENIAFSGTLTRTSGEDVGTYSIGIGTLTNTNYTLSYTPKDFIINKLPVTIITTAGQSKTYGVADASLSYTISPSTLSDSTAISLGGTLSRTLGENVGTYTITIGTVSDTNYEITLSPETFAINKKTITASASSVSKQYDATTDMAGVRLSLATLETGDIVTVNGTGSFSSLNVGTSLGYTIAGLYLSGTDANNYFLNAGTSFSGSNGEITKAPLSITANDDNGVDTDPAFSGGNGVNYSGFKGTDTVSDLSGTLAYTGSSQGATAAGAYAIEPTGITSSNYSITFVAGSLTIIVGDSDGDGVRDPSDNCPTTPNSDQADTDADGVGDVCDNAPNIPNADQRDTDADGIGNVIDTDDDNDGCPDSSDAFPLDPSECSDNDADGIGDNADPDDDNDSVLDTTDNCPFTPNTNQSDIDADGIGDVCDNDDDNDGYSDQDEIACGSDPLDASSKPLDTDSDGIPDCVDTDDDNDGYLDENDAFPLDATEWLDSDNDGIGNNTDTDDDGDGQLDTDEITCGSDPLDASSMSLDTDSDGIPDCVDTDDDNDGILDTSDNCPLTSNADQKDTDSDGIGDVCDNDDDGDGVLDTNDAFPLDPTEWTDTDADGIGNNADNDDDNDGFSDLDELVCDSDPLDRFNKPADQDNDLIPDCVDPDRDGDGYDNNQDVFPDNDREWEDFDKDGLGNNFDVDDDNDGCLDATDLFPLNPNECSDADNDGIGDNADPDDNNDGFDDDKLFVSGLLTPGSSGLEDTWKVINIEQYPNARVIIYNRNAQEVFSVLGYKNNWRGTYKGSSNLLPAGSYYYVVDLNNGEKPITGWLYLTY